MTIISLRSIQLISSKHRISLSYKNTSHAELSNMALGNQTYLSQRLLVRELSQFQVRSAKTTVSLDQWWMWEWSTSFDHLLPGCDMYTLPYGSLIASTKIDSRLQWSPWLSGQEQHYVLNCLTCSRVCVTKRVLGYREEESKHGHGVGLPSTNLIIKLSYNVI